ncbi:recombinase family protein [Thomasclavelia sp.]|uniref:recombinase family protein n=1 Tax=Thomasclavelia sp. TaxID=3025757 RepID=UPI0025FE089D|nr:recombinase family protein [Thomasclavelia sp.]
MNKLNAFIYCRVLTEEARNLLMYQEEILSKKAVEDGYEIFGKVCLVDTGKSFGSFKMQALIGYIRKEKINAIYVYDRTRLCIYKDLYMEFKMLCDMHHVEIICLNS